MEKKKGIALKTSSRNEKLYEDSGEDEDAEMTIVKRYKKLVFQHDQQMGRRSFKRD